MESLINTLKESKQFYCDQVTYKYGRNKDWVHDQVSTIDNFSYEVMNETSIGNLLFIYDHAYIEDRKKIEKFLNRLMRDLKKSMTNK